jgi:hypothetical protein
MRSTTTSSRGSRLAGKPALELFQVVDGVWFGLTAQELGKLLERHIHNPGGPGMGQPSFERGLARKPAHCATTRCTNWIFHPVCNASE